MGSTKNQFDKIKDNLLNNRVIAISLVLFVMYLGVNEFIDATAKIKSNLVGQDGLLKKSKDHSKYVNKDSTIIEPGKTIIPKTDTNSEASDEPNQLANPKRSFKKSYSPKFDDPQESLEVSIQLSEGSNGFKDIYLDSKKIETSSTSTKLNPRILIFPKRKAQKILIITNSLDSCYVQDDFSNFIHKKIARYVAQCN